MQEVADTYCEQYSHSYRKQHFIQPFSLVLRLVGNHEEH